MARRSSVQTLPPSILERLNKLLAGGELTLDEVVAWLDQAGHARSRSAVHRHSQTLARMSARLRQSREMIEALGRDLGDAAIQGKQGRALVEMARTFVFDMMLRFDASDEELSPKDVAFLGKGLAELGRALRLDQDFEVKLREQVARQAAERAERAAREQGEKHGFTLPPEALQAIREQVYGIVDVR